jgi:hypothetical protein
VNSSWGFSKCFGRRKGTRHFKSVSHGFTHTREPQGVRLLRQWLKNINHQTEPAAEFFSALGAHIGGPGE